MFIFRPDNSLEDPVVKEAVDTSEEEEEEEDGDDDNNPENDPDVQDVNWF